MKGQNKQGPDEAGGQLASWKPVGGAATTIAGTLNGEAAGGAGETARALAAKTRPAPVLLSLAGSSKALVV